MKKTLMCLAISVLCYSQASYTGVVDRAAAKVIIQSRAAELAAQLQRKTALVQAEKARKLYSAQKYTKRLAAAEQKAKSLASGVVNTSRHAPKIANDVYKRISNSKLVKHTKNSSANLHKNKIGGKVGEIRCGLDYEAAGYNTLRQVTARIGSQTRRIDLVVQHPITKQWSAVEIKTGISKYSYTKPQRTFDSTMASQGALLIGKNAGPLAGMTLKIPTTLLRY